MIFRNDRTGLSTFVGSQGGKLKDAALKRLWAAIAANDDDAVIRLAVKQRLSARDTQQVIKESLKEFKRIGGS